MVHTLHMHAKHSSKMTGGILVNKHKSFENNSNMFLTFPKGEQKSNPLLFGVMLNLFF